MKQSAIPVGIDLGTTFSAVAFVDAQGRPNTIENSEGESTTPTIVFFDHDGVIIGSEAEVAGEGEPERQARLAKRDMGGAFYQRSILGHRLPPEIIQSLVLHRIKNDAALRIGEFEKAVITVPAYFNEPRRKATQDAGKIAGIDVIDIINEPTAAALAYGVQRGFLDDQGVASEKEIVLVYDLGGGTFDATLMEIDGNQFTALATAGDVYLGGVDWDRAIFDHASKVFLDEHGIDCESDPVLAEKLIRECTRAKKSLSARAETIIRLDANGTRIKFDFSRSQFEELTRPLLERTRLTTDRLLKDAKFKWSDLTKLLLVGGSTRMPMVGNMLEKESGLTVDRSISPDEAVAHGAAIYAGILLKHGPTAGKGISVANVNSHDLGVLGLDPKSGKPKRQVIIPRNHTLPASQSRKFQTSKDGQAKVVVQIIEGGTENGQGATHIGKCIVDSLPPDLPKGTDVTVGFTYSSAGRLEVVAELPSLKRNAETSINRAQGMGQDEIAHWQRLISKGFQIDELEKVKFEKASVVDVVETVEVVENSNSGQLDELDDVLADPVEPIDSVDETESATSISGFADVADLSPVSNSATLSQVKIDGDSNSHSAVVKSDVLNELSLTEEGAKELASESILNVLEQDNATEAKKASGSDTSLNDFLKGLP